MPKLSIRVPSERCDPLDLARPTIDCNSILVFLMSSSSFDTEEQPLVLNYSVIMASSDDSSSGGAASKSPSKKLLYEKLSELLDQWALATLAGVPLDVDEDWTAPRSPNIQQDLESFKTRLHSLLDERAHLITQWDNCLFKASNFRIISSDCWARLCRHKDALVSSNNDDVSLSHGTLEEYRRALHGKQILMDEKHYAMATSRIMRRTFLILPRPQLSLRIFQSTLRMCTLDCTLNFVHRVTWHTLN